MRTRGGSSSLQHRKAAWACVCIFLLAVSASFLYIVFTGTYNGDFYGVPERLGLLPQLLLYLTTLLPYGMVWWMYRAFKRRPVRGSIPVPDRLVTVVYFVLLAWFVFLTIKYDVGVLGRPLYEAPATITPLIQVTNRINPFYLGVLFILTHQGRRSTLWIGIAGLIALGILRAGLGVFIYVALALVVRHHAQIVEYTKRNRTKLLLIATLFPLFVSQMYEVRSMLRDSQSVEIAMSLTDVVVAKFVGRLSGLSNSAMVVQETSYFERESRNLDTFYFQRQASAGFLGVSVVPDYIPERMLININGGNFFDVSFMVGVVGNLYIAWLISPWLALLDIATILAMCAATFLLLRKLRFPLANEFALLLLLYPLTSGVSTEFSIVVAAALSFCVLFAVLAIRLVGRRSPRPRGPTPERTHLAVE